MIIESQRVTVRIKLINRCEAFRIILGTWLVLYKGIAILLFLLLLQGTG